MRIVFGIFLSMTLASSALADGLYYYPLAPCRVADTRTGPGGYGNTGLSNGQTRGFRVEGVCKVPTCAKSASLNIAVVVVQTPGTIGNITVYPNNISRPLASTLNVSSAIQGASAIANGAIIPLAVPTGSTNPNDPDLNVYAAMAMVPPWTHRFDIVLDVNGYFAESGCTPLP